MQVARPRSVISVVPTAGGSLQVWLLVTTCRKKRQASGTPRSHNSSPNPNHNLQEEASGMAHALYG